MKKVFKFFLYLLFTVVSLLVFTGIIIDVFYSDNIERSVVKTIQLNLKSKVNLSDVEFTLWEHFPYASVQFNNILAFEGEGFDNDTLLYAKEVFVDLNIIDKELNENYNKNKHNMQKLFVSFSCYIIFEERNYLKIAHGGLINVCEKLLAKDKKILLNCPLEKLIMEEWAKLY